MRTVAPAVSGASVAGAEAWAGPGIGGVNVYGAGISAAARRGARSSKEGQTFVFREFSKPLAIDAYSLRTLTPVRDHDLFESAISGLLAMPFESRWTMGVRARAVMTKAHSRRRWELTAAVGAAWWIEKLLTVEWSYPYCGVRDSGPAAAVRGFPFPYEQASIVTSATDFFIPWLYVVNLAVIAGAIFLLLRPLMSRLWVSTRPLPKLIVHTAAALLLLSAFASEGWLLSIGVWRPASSLFSAEPRYSELRPVALRIFEHPRDCTASPFWFPRNGTGMVIKSKP